MMVILPPVLMALMWGGPGVCPVATMAMQLQNINDKMEQKKPDGGADLIWGTGICTIYVKPCEDLDNCDTVESNSNEFGVKIILHEYIHCIQQGLVSGDVVIGKTYTPEVHVENPCGVPDEYVTKTKAAFASLPAEYKLIKKVVVFYAGCAKKSYSWGELQGEQFYGWGCPGMSSVNSASKNLNVFEEGEAEYYAMNVLMPAAVASWTTPYNGPSEWTNKLNEGKTNCGFPGNSDFRFKAGTGTYIEEELVPKLKSAGFDACRNNAIGENVMRFLVTTYRPATTSLELKQVWAKTGEVGFGAAWQAVMGSSWSAFIMAMEKDPYYNIDSSSTGAAGQEHYSSADSSLMAVFTIFTIIGVCLMLWAVFLTFRWVKLFKRKGAVRISNEEPGGDSSATQIVVATGETEDKDPEPAQKAA
eukprot:CAMPEP_0175140688 /NCGR_PEP_ID=MMETSP0087-20121206/11663_1 /TAXON_ID=136419 /ORGANISM="Unknown Unknown, Strain D1" /LENGTH=416 /DNA_ID=CAMNT_0016423969 /DNA_START=89 /DNA_END=1339 /DNA_ORIENTATION=+